MTVAAKLIWLATFGHDEIVMPPTSEGRHADLVTRVSQSSETWYLRERPPVLGAGAHRREQGSWSYPDGRNRLIALPVRNEPRRTYIWWRAGTNYPGVTSRIGDRDNTRQRLVHLS